MIIRFVIPVVFINKLDWSVCTCLTQLYLMVEICIEFTTQRTTTCFSTCQWPSSGCEMKKKLSSSHTRLMWGVHRREVRGEVGTRSRMCYVGRARSRAHLTSYFPTVDTPHKSSIAAY